MFAMISQFLFLRSNKVPAAWVAFTPYGFWYLAEVILRTNKYTKKTLNTLLLAPVPILSILAFISLFIRYSYVKYKCLRSLGMERLEALPSILPLYFYIIILRRR